MSFGGTVDEDILYQSIPELARQIRSKATSPVELTRAYVERLQALAPQLYAVVTMTEDLAMEQARQAESEILRGNYRGVLHGIPWGAKDLLATAGIKTQWGSPAYQGQVFDYDATVVRKLHEAGAVLIAKLSLGELASGARWFGGTTRCPWDTMRSSSGSSAGPAAATAAGMVAFSVGSETLGSIISPSAINGVVGLRPTYGRVSRHGAMALGWTMDKIGPICRHVEDCALVLSQIIGRDPQDPASVDAPFDYFGQLSPVWADTTRIGVVMTEFDLPDDEVSRIINSVLGKLEELGFVLEDVELADFPYREVARYTINVEAATTFEPLWKSGRLKDLIDQRRAADWSAARMIPATDYLKLQRVRAEIAQYAKDLLQRYTVLVAPSVPFTARLVDPPASAGTPAPGSTLPRRDTLPLGNLAGLPGVSVPCGFTQSGLPLGIYFVGRPFGEAGILAIAQAYQQATPWHQTHPRFD